MSARSAEDTDNRLTRRAVLCRGAAGALALSLCRCDQSGDPALTSGKNRLKGFLALVGASETDLLWPMLEAGARTRAPHLPWAVRTFAPAGREGATQETILRDLIHSDVRAVAVQLPDSGALAGLRDLHTRGIPVVTILQRAPDLEFAHAGFDNAKAGQLLAEAVGRALPDGGTLMILHAGRTHPVYGPRLVALEEGLRVFSRVEVFASVEVDPGSGQAEAEIARRSARFPRLDAWVLIGDWPVRDPSRIRSALPSACRLIVCGCTPPVWSLMRDGRCPAAVAGPYWELGDEAMRLCELALGERSQFAAGYLMAPFIVTPGDLGAFTEQWAAGTSQPAPEK